MNDLAELDALILQRHQRAAQLASDEERARLAREALDLLAAREREARALLEREQQDVGELEGLTLRSLFHRLLGTRDEELVRERREVVEAQLTLERHGEAISSAHAELEELERELLEFAPARAELLEAIEAKESWIASHDAAGAARLFELQELSSALHEELRELEAAGKAGRAASEELEYCYGCLRKARQSQLWTITGGYGLAEIPKGEMIDEARESAAHAEALLMRFERALLDLQRHEGAQAYLEGPIQFMQRLLDALVVDWAVNESVVRSLHAVRESLDWVERTRWRLSERVGEARTELDGLTEERLGLVRQWS